MLTANVTIGSPLSTSQCASSLADVATDSLPAQLFRSQNRGAKTTAAVQHDVARRSERFDVKPKFLNHLDARMQFAKRAEQS